MTDEPKFSEAKFKTHADDVGDWTIGPDTSVRHIYTPPPWWRRLWNWITRKPKETGGSFSYHADWFPEWEDPVSPYTGYHNERLRQEAKFTPLMEKAPEKYARSEGGYDKWVEHGKP